MIIIKQFIKHLILILTIGYFILFPLLHYFHALNPLEKELGDFKFSDIYFSYVVNKSVDDDIYFIDIGIKSKEITRLEVAKCIEKLNTDFKPKVIAVDVNFPYSTDVSDSINNRLISALNSDNIVMSYSLMNASGYWLKDKTELAIDRKIVNEGFSNNLVDKVEYGVERFFLPNFKIDGVNEHHFSVVISEKAGYRISDNLLKSQEKVMINFSYDYNNPININDTLDYDVLEDKIVIIGILTKNAQGAPMFNDDVHYTPSNPMYLGKSPPNMYGAEIVANIISNIRDNSFIEFYPKLSWWLNILMSLLVYFSLLFFMNKSHNIFIATSIFTQFGLVSLFIILSMFFVSKFNVYIDLTLLGVITFFGVEFVGVIDEIIHLISDGLKRLRLKFLDKL
tara:strand:- start:1767 stop:2951 length:1185 start_codon:yes stop_codon:yes gene_type:complete